MTPDGQTLRPDHSKGDDEKNKKEETQKEEDTSDSAGRENHGRHHHEDRAQDGGDQAKGDKMGHQRRVIRGSSPEDDPIGDKNRKAVNEDHPGTIQSALHPPGEKDLFARNRHRVNEGQVLAEVQLGERRQDPAEKK